jgi:ADP-heptose:LPS heptosyltransferase
LVELAGLLGGVSGFVGHDSGITHLAAAMGVPTIALWGNSSVEVWAPKGPKAHILRAAGGLASLDPRAVFNAIAEKAN